MKRWIWYHRQEWGKLLWAVPLVILNNFSDFFAWLFQFKGWRRIYSDIYFDMFLDQAFIRFAVIEGQITSIDVLESGFMLLLPAAFAMLFGTYVYNELNVRGTYALIRHRSRAKWYIKRCMELGLFAFLYAALQVFLPFLWFLAVGRGEITQSQLFLLLLAFFSAWMFDYFFALLVNLIAIELGSVMGFVISYAGMIVSYLILSRTDLLTLKKMCFLPARVTLLLQVNESLPIRQFLWGNRYGWGALLILIAYTAVLGIYGAVRVCYKDVGLYNQENLI